MAGNTVKEMTTNFGKLDKFEGHDFRRWQKKMHFLLTTLKVVYVLNTLMPELMEDDTVEGISQRSKCENDDYICRGHILNGMSDSLFDIYQNVESAKDLWDSLESKYMAEDALSKKFLVSNFNNYKMIDSRLVMEQFNELLRILGQYTQHGLKMDESIYVLSVIDKLPPSWKDFKHTLKHGKDDLSLVQLGSHLRIEESLRAQDSDKGKSKEVAEPSVNIVTIRYFRGKPRYVNRLYQLHRNDHAVDRDDRYHDDPIRGLGLKIEIPEFTSKVYPDDFIDWLSKFERVFDVRDIPDKLKVKLVAIKLRQHASLWAFLDYHNLSQRNMTVEEVINAFDKLCMRCDVVEEEEQVVARFLGVLKPEIADIVSLQPYWTYTD
ncbi:zinc finger, CCHC-type containing protein [Tanacetum coccineum]